MQPSPSSPKPSLLANGHRPRMTSNTSLASHSGSDDDLSKAGILALSIAVPVPLSAKVCGGGVCMQVR